MGWALFTPTGSNGEILVSTDWITGIAPAFRRKWDQRFESAFLQRGVRNELLIDAAPFGRLH